MGSIGRITYLLGWVCLAAAIVYKLLLSYSHAGMTIYSRSSAVPRNFFELAAVLFLAAIATSVLPHPAQK